MAISLHNVGSVSGTRPAPRARPLILVAEDNDDTRFMFRMMLEITGCEVIEATDGEQTVSVAERDRPDLIMMDVRLPLVDGFEATRRIRQFANVHEVAIVFISGQADVNSRARAREAGCDEYLVKPVHLDQLGTIIKRYIANSAGAFEYSEPGRVST